VFVKIIEDNDRSAHGEAWCVLWNLQRLMSGDDEALYAAEVLCRGESVLGGLATLTAALRSPNEKAVGFVAVHVGHLWTRHVLRACSRDAAEMLEDFFGVEGIVRAVFGAAMPGAFFGGTVFLAAMSIQEVGDGLV
jgi:hypothetical protein